MVDYLLAAGTAPWYPSYSHSLMPGLSLHVNLADGNLALHATDLSNPAVGVPVTIDRWYNSSLAFAANSSGYGWTVGSWPSVRADGHFHEPEGPRKRPIQGQGASPTLLVTPDGEFR